MNNTVLTPKQISNIIKNKPYKDGEALIWDFGRFILSDFYKWENERDGGPKILEGKTDKVVAKYLQRILSSDSYIPSPHSVRDEIFNEVIGFVSELEYDGVAFPNDFKHRLIQLRDRLK